MSAVKNKGGNISNLAMHLHRNHAIEYDTINPKHNLGQCLSIERN